MIVLEGSLGRIRFRNETTFYTVAELAVAKQKNRVTIVGVMPAVTPGQTIRVTGSWVAHPRYGQQFKVSNYEAILPATVEGIKQYLQSGLIPGVGPALAESIVACFGADTLQVLSAAPERLTEVAGVGQAKAAMIRAAWQEHHLLKALMDFLQAKGLDAAYSSRIFREYGEEALEVLRTDPFRLAEDIPGVGFVVADALALDAGEKADDPRRIRACLLHLLEQNANSGHVFCYLRHLEERCETLFRIASGAVEIALESLAAAGEVVLQEMPGPDPEVTIVYPGPLYRAEHGIAERLRGLAALPPEAPAADADQMMQQVVRRLAIKPSREQMTALETMFAHRVVVVTGGPGTGKTTLVRAITAIYEEAGKKVVLTAPTGRAAKRLAELSRKEAQTIHRLLGYSFGEDVFFRNSDNPLRADAVVVDEASMVDIQLFYHLLCATPVTAMLVLVGDVFQLPSVGPGNVLRDVIDSGLLPVFSLTEVFRQAATSRIVENAHRIRNGLFPELPAVAALTPELDCCFIEESDPGAVAVQIVKLCRQTIPETFGLDPLQEVQVLTPMHKGEAGTINLNQQLQKVLNPSSPAVNAGGSGFRVSDKVMQLRNNYAKEVFNGDIGTIAAVDVGKQALTVDYYDRLVDYAFTETEELSLAYAITVHKSQGSEYPAVIVPVLTQHYALLERNLLYTAVTRARRLLVLVGTEKAIGVAMKKNAPRRRLSLLACRLNPDLDLAGDI